MLILSSKLLLVAMLCPAIAPRSLYAKARVTAAIRDTEYAAALATANRFLHAWQEHDHETGLVMLSDEAKRKVSEERVESFFASGPDAAYEITQGKRVSAGRYDFPIVLLEDASAGLHPRPHLRFSHLVVVKTGRNDWGVDRLP